MSRKARLGKTFRASPQRAAHQQKQPFDFANVRRKAKFNFAAAISSEEPDLCVDHSTIKVRPLVARDAGNVAFVAIQLIGTATAEFDHAAGAIRRAEIRMNTVPLRPSSY